MEAIQVVAAFSDITSQLIANTDGQKDKSQIKLHFTFNSGLLRAHDYFNHKRSIILAIYSEQTEKWWCCLKQDGYGAKLICEVVSKNNLDSLERVLKDLYSTHGSFPFGLT